MVPPTLQLDVLPFSKQKLSEAIRQASGASHNWKPNEQASYLAEFLSHDPCKAGSMLVEKPYVDRHYIEEHSRYYATVLRAPSPHATRLHFFTESFSKRDLLDVLASAAHGDDAYAKAIARLGTSYLGFCVVRPIPSAPIGRTVLRPYHGSEPRILRTVLPHRVHLCGLELTIGGAPFQQQEVAVGACATTAIWSALAVATRAMGARPPTPFEVTDAATKHVLNDRPFPADSGLNLQQALSAIRALGFAPHTLKPSHDPGSFSIAVKTYLQSGFPVVLLLGDGLEQHAITALGYRDPPNTHSAQTYVTSEGLSSPGMARVYVHEDRLGPYARMNWILPDLQCDHDEPPGNAKPKATPFHDGVLLQHQPYDDAQYNYDTNVMPVYAAIVPLYPKLRLSALGLIKAAAELQPLLRMWGLDQTRTRVELRFQLSGAYLREIQTLPLPPETGAFPLAMQAVFPRYVGVARFFQTEGAFMDAVFDTTDVLRTEPCYSRLLTLVALTETYRESVRAFVRSQVPHAIGF